jgi:hypothetical protein
MFYFRLLLIVAFVACMSLVLDARAEDSRGSGSDHAGSIGASL